jgi:perosamine synthetase
MSIQSEAPHVQRSEPGAPAEAGAIPLAVPVMAGNEWAYVKECIDTAWVSSVGSYVDRFEKDLARYAGARHAVATASGTAALHIALLVAGVQPDDEVLVSTLTFIAPVNAIRYAGAWPVLMDADPETWQMDVAKVARFLEEECYLGRGEELRNRTTGRRVRAILPVHILGHLVDMDPLLDLARRYRLAVIEDATESLGARYKGRHSGTLGDLGCFSFNGNKIITTGGGGMIVTDNPEYARRAKYLTTQAKDDPVEFVHGEIGYNYRLTNIQAALGCAQLERLDDYVAAKRRIARQYAEAFTGLPGITLLRQPRWAESTWWLYTILINAEEARIGSRDLLRRMTAARIQTRPLWQPAHRSPAHAGSQAYACEVADRLNRDALSLPSSVDLTDEQQARVIDEIRRAVEG